MASDKFTLPALLEVVRSDGTFVMDCDSGIALISLPGQHAAPARAQHSKRARRPKSKLPRNK